MRLPYSYRLISPRRLVILAVLLSFLYLVWRMISDSDHQRWYEREAPCQTPENLITDMTELAFRIHNTFVKLNIPHFLCYGTLWGVVRTGSILPWDNNVDFCVLDEDISKVDEGFLYTSFQRSQLSISYDTRHGVYNIRYKSAEGAVTVFQRFFDQMQRAGWEIRLLPFMYKYQDEFPSRLVEKPFPTKKFLGAEFPVPREDIELLKYLYPDDWWKEIKPKGC